VSIETISTFTRRFAASHSTEATAAAPSSAARRRPFIVPAILSARSRALRFGGADRFLLLVDRELRRAGATGFHGALGVELEGRLDRPRLARAFDRLRRAHPRISARLVPASPLRDWRLEPDRGGLAREALAWANLRTVAGAGGGPAAAAFDLAPFVAERAAAPLDPTRDPLVDLAVRELDGPRTQLVLRLWHPIVDERGAELLLRELSALDEEPTAATAGDEPLPCGDLTFAERRAAFRRARRRLDELTPAPPLRLPAGAADGAAARWTFERTRLDAAATTAWLARAEARYGLRGEGLAQLGAAARALADGAPDAAFVALPLTIQRRAPRARAPVASNALSFHWHAFAAGATRDEARFAAQLLASARARVAADEERDAVILMEQARRMPLAIYRRELLRRDGSARFTAALSTLGELLGGARELFGLPLVDAHAVTTFPSPPGLGLVFSRAAGRLSFTTVSWSRDVASGAAAALHRRIAAGLAADRRAGAEDQIVDRPQRPEGSS